jgi:O-antigen/teichoic acid export membrane protein
MTFYRSDHADGSTVPMARELRWTAQYQSKTTQKKESGNRIVRAIRRNITMLANSTTVFATTIVTSMLGFAYWWVATHLMSQGQVGTASSGVATMAVVSTLGVWGLGTMLVAEVQKVRAGTEWNLISTAAVVAFSNAILGGLVFVGLSMVYPSLVGGRVSIAFLLQIVIGCGLAAAGSLVDDSLVGLFAPRLQLLRNTYMAVIKLVLLIAVALLPSLRTATTLITCWNLGVLLSFVALLIHMMRSELLTSLRPRFSMLRGKGKLATGHNVLNLSLFLPRTALPILVTTFVTAHATAGFYTAWMIFTMVGMVPTSLSNMLYATVATDLKALRAKTRFVLLASGLAGAPAIAVLVLGARPIMGLFGDAYGDSGFILIVLCFTYPTSVLRNVYLATARVRQRMRTATTFAICAAVGELTASITGAKLEGVNGLAEAYALVVVAEGCVLLPRILQLSGVLPPAKRDIEAAKRGVVNVPAQRRPPSPADYVMPSQLEVLGDVLSANDQTAIMPRISGNPHEEYSAQSVNFRSYPDIPAPRPASGGAHRSRG